jgi:hypothetical protein
MYAVYIDGQLYQKELGAQSCATIRRLDIGSCPHGGSGQVVITCLNSNTPCPLLYW